jgi:hypothetical protein
MMNASEHSAASDQSLLQAARRTFEIEGAALAALRSRLDATFIAACRLCLQCHGRIVVTGMGKSGHIAHKIAATLASTGSAAFFLHAAEASHGDLGMLARGDVLLALSNSGETEEVLALLPQIKRMAVPLIALTGNLMSRCPKKPVRTIWRLPPARPRRWSWAMRSRWRSWRHAVSRPRISRARILAADWDADCCCASRTSCDAAIGCRACVWKRPCRTGCSR